MITEEATLTQPQLHKKRVIEFLNETWRLLDKRERTPKEDARMLNLAHASRLHWEFMGSAENLAVGEWQVSRVHAVLLQSDAALFHAQRSLDISKRNHLTPFHVACAHEAMARAVAFTHPQAASEHIATARRLAAEITDPGEKKILDDDLSSILSPRLLIGQAANRWIR
ncbi:MAG: hypothetical protein QOD99_2429 [Chthoniobacter sp.]|jgi:hypothetical protein|nr:hypothetical protein [Chthoniobacter sp.]